MASKGETDEQRDQLDCASIHTVDSGVGSLLGSLSLDDRTVTQPDGDANRGSIIQAAFDEADAVPDMVDLREGESSSNEIQTSEIASCSRELQPSFSTEAPALSPSSWQEYHQVEQAEACTPGIVSSMGQQSRGADQSLSQREPVGIQWRPERRQPEFFDIAMVYCMEDEDLAKKFGDILQKFILLDGQQKPRIYTDFLDLSDSLGCNKMEHFDYVLGCSSFSFVFFSLQSVDSQDLKGKFYRTVTLHGSITDKNCAKVVPIVTKPNLPLQYSFGVLNEISLKSLLLGDRILELVSVEELKMEHISKRVLDRISDALNDARRKRQYKETNCGASNFEQPVDVNPPTTQTADQKSGHTGLIQRYYADLIDSMYPGCELLSCLFSKMVLSYIEMENITAETTRRDKNKKLLNLLYLKDAKSFETFVCCLSETNQDHLAKLLRGPKNNEHAFESSVPHMSI